MNITRIAAFLFVAASSVAAAPGAGLVLVGYPSESGATDTSALRQFELLGGTSGAGQWLESDKLKVGSATYTLYNLAGKVGAVKGGVKTSYGPPCEQTYGVDVSPAPKRDDWWMALSGTWNARPRALRVLPNDHAVYRGVVRELLVKRGLKNPVVSLERVVRVDLDGDQSDEVVIAANHFANGNGLFPPARGQAGDYGVVLVRKIVAGKLQTFELGSNVILTSLTPAQIDQGMMNIPDKYELVNVLDLNGDGKMEVVTFNAIYEDSAVSAWEWDGKQYKTRLISGCGV
jgi:hypothetical protein